MRAVRRQAITWRRTVLAQELIFTFPFHATKLGAESIAGNSASLIDASAGTWRHWLSAPSASGDIATLSELYDASRDFLEDIRKVLFPEFALSLPNGFRTIEHAARVGEQVDERLSALRAGRFSQAALRLRYKGAPVGRNIHVDVKGTRYRVVIDYIDVCLFEDGHAVLIIRLTGLSKADGSNLDTFEAGNVVRSLKKIEFRERTRVLPPTFIDGDEKYTWVSLLTPLVEPWAKSFAEIAGESAAAQFRVVSFASIPRDPALHVTSNEGPFRTDRERLHFELATGHDTSDSQELPTQDRVDEIRRNGLVRQWVTFDALVFWDDATFLVEDRTGSSDPVREGPDAPDGYARTEYPKKVRNVFIWLMVVANYQELKLLEFLRRLTQLTQKNHRDLEETLQIADEYVKFTNLYWHRAVTPSQSGQAIHAAMERMLHLGELENAVGMQLERAKTHLESQLAHRAERDGSSVRFWIAALGIIFLPIGVAVDLLQTAVGKDLDAAGTWISFGGLLALLVLLALLAWWMQHDWSLVWLHAARWRIRRGKEKLQRRLQKVLHRIGFGV